jgi:hypothetical protein
MSLPYLDVHRLRLISILVSITLTMQRDVSKLSGNTATFTPLSRRYDFVLSG